MRSRVASWLVSSGRAWLSRAIRSSAIAALIVGACQRRTTTGQPIRMPKAPDDRRCSASGVSQSPMSSASHVDQRALGQIGQVALHLGQLPVQHQAGADQLVVGVEPAERLVSPLGLHRTPGRRLQEAGRGQGADEAEVLLGADRAHGQTGGRRSLLRALLDGLLASRDAHHTPTIATPSQIRARPARVRHREFTHPTPVGSPCPRLDTRVSAMSPSIIDLPEAELRDGLAVCLHVPRWVDDVAERAPYSSLAELEEIARAAATPLSARRRSTRRCRPTRGSGRRRAARAPPPSCRRRSSPPAPPAIRLSTRRWRTATGRTRRRSGGSS